MKSPRPNHLAAITTGFAQLFAGQLSTRVLTFFMNLLIVRRLPPEALGLGVQFYVVTTLVLLLSREGFRRACLRSSTREGAEDFKREAEHVVCISLWTVPTSALVSLVVTALLLNTTDAATDPAIHKAYILHGVAAFLEVCAEPFFILTQARLLWWPRVLADTAANVARGVTQLALVLHFGALLHPALLFGWSQMVFAGISLVCCGYHGMAVWKQSGARLRLLRWSPDEWESMKLVGTFTLQAVGKFVLAEGSKLVLMRVGSSYNQGVYALVHNLGSLVVRTIFQPLEEAAFAAFSRLQVAAGNAEGQKQAARSLALLVRVAAVPGLLALTFGPAYSYTLLRLLYGTKWASTEAPTVLAFYTAYVFLLAINGVLEAFVHAVLDRQKLSSSNAVLVATSLAHMGAAAALAWHLGTVGLLLADSLNMLLRIATSCWYIRRQFSGVPGFSLHWLLLSGTSLLCFAAAGAAVTLSQAMLMGGIAGPPVSAQFWKDAAAHVAVGATILVALLGTLYWTERKTLQEVKQVIGRSN